MLAVFVAAILAAGIAITVVVAVAWNGDFFLVAITSKDQAAVLGLQPLFMPIIMFSTFFAPTTNAPDWFKTVARINPFTALLDGTRSILSASTDLLDLALGIGAFAAIGVITYGLAARSYAGLVTAD